MKTVPLYFWSPSPGDWHPDRVENWGDFLSVPLLQAMGYNPVRYVAQDLCLVAIGSTIGTGRFPRGTRAFIWGSGIGYGDLRPEATFCAVRGPLSARRFGLDCPIGDPALLLARYFPLQLAPAEPLFIPHHADAGRLPGLRWISTAIRAREWFSLPQAIARASIVLSGSLHGAIVAQSYGIPWSPACASDAWARDGFNRLKWLDFLLSIGLREEDLALAQDAASAQQWWAGVAGRIRVPDLDALVAAFPDAAF